MATLIHIAEVAALLFVAYVVGWAVGYAARRTSVRIAKPAVTISAVRLAAARGEGQPSDALVKAPVVAPVTISPPPSVAAKAVPTSSESARPVAPVSALESLASLSKTMPLEPVAPAQPPAEIIAATVEPPKAEEAAQVDVPMAIVEVPPNVAPAPDVPVVAPVEAVAPPVTVVAPVEPPAPPAMPASAPGLAWSGAINGHAAEPHQPLLPVVAEPVAPAVAAAEYDEDAAMRAIEGGWSRRAARALPNTPELSDMGAAVAAAQSAVHQVLAQEGVDPETEGFNAHRVFGKPLGLPRPRDGARDNLKQISGLRPSDESTLNNMGIYHFDQIAGWDQKEVLWMENHVFERGRIGRENWQAQAQDLARGKPQSRTLRA